MSASVSPAAAAPAANAPDSANSAPAAASAATPAPPRVPKLAPAPVPVETPWKAPAVDSAPLRPPREAELAKPAPKSGGDESAPAQPKRSTTGKEKWVPYAPVVPINPSPNRRPKRHNPSNGASTAPAASTARARRHHHAGAENSRTDGKDRRKSGLGTTARSAGHHRAPRPDSSAELEKASAEKAETSAEPAQTGAESATSTPSAGSATSSGSASENGGETTPAVENLHLERPRSVKTRPNTFRRKDKPHRAPFYGYPLASAPYGVVPVPVDYRHAAEYVFPALVNQVNHYFSVDNLCRDMFLRSNMNDEGLVPIAVIGAFNRVKMMTTDWQVVYQACQSAPNVVVIGHKVRAAENWERWLVPVEQRTAAGREVAAEPVRDLRIAAQQAVPFVPRQ